MKRIKNGDIVGRISYNKDIIFIVKDIQDKKNVIIEGVFERIIADSNIEDLELINLSELKKQERLKELKIKEKENRYDDIKISGLVLHLDGDRKYSEKSAKYYKKMGVRAIVKNIPENRQPKVVYNLLQYYRPDILVITGHDSMIKKGYNYYDIYNYRNSKHFIATVIEARRFERSTNSNLVIFARSMSKLF